MTLAKAPARQTHRRAPLWRALMSAGIASLSATLPLQAQTQEPQIPLSPEAFAARAAEVQATATTLRDIPINCTIKPLRVVELSAPISGVAAEVYVRPGMQVDRGTALLRLDDRVSRAELELARARAENTAALEAAQTRHDGLSIKVERLAKAAERRAISASEYEAAALDLALAEAEVAKERETLHLAELEAARVATLVASSEITSPVAGVIGEDLIDPGEAAGANPIVTIYVNQPLRVEAFVPSAQLADFIARQHHFIRVGSDSAPIEVTFDYAAQVADLASNTISVFFRLNAPEILPGSQCIMTGEGA